MTSYYENVRSCKRHTVVRHAFCFWRFALLFLGLATHYHESWSGVILGTLFVIPISNYRLFVRKVHASSLIHSLVQDIPCNRLYHQKKWDTFWLLWLLISVNYVICVRSVGSSHLKLYIISVIYYNHTCCLESLPYYSVMTKCKCKTRLWVFTSMKTCVKKFVLTISYYEL